MSGRVWRVSGPEGSASASGRTEELRARLEQAQAGERRAQALLESVASLMGGVDTDEALAGIAENAVRHIGIPRVSTFRADHDDGLLIEVARAELDADDGHLPLPGMAKVRMAQVDPEPVPLGPGNLLAEFALDDEAYRLLSPDETPDGSDAGVLVQMRCGSGTPASPRGVLVGVIVACSDEQVTPRQMDLLSAFASLGAAAADAARTEEFRTQLISSVSHELRTPLSAIRAYNELLLDGDAGDINEEQRLFLQRIETTCLQLDRMVEDILDLSRLRAGEMVIDKRLVDVVAVIWHIIDTLSPEAARSEVTLDAQIDGELAPISSNADRLAQVLFNLVGNAVKYVGAGGNVLVRVGVRDRREYAQLSAVVESRQPSAVYVDQCLAIEVIDDGPGIAHEDINSIFDEFYRGRATAGSTKGSGLGLAIAARLTRLLGGAIGVESSLREGSTFVLVFPLAPDDADD